MAEEGGSDHLDRGVGASDPSISVLPSPRPSTKGGLVLPTGSMDGFYLVSFLTLYLLFAQTLKNNLYWFKLVRS